MEDDHRHCKVCGKVCPPNSETCSAACKATRTRTIESRRQTTYLFYGLMIFVVLLLLVFRI
jgi:predicted nucleic acid-binding Zn ribbon protein